MSAANPVTPLTAPEYFADTLPTSLIITITTKLIRDITLHNHTLAHPDHIQFVRNAVHYAVLAAMSGILCPDTDLYADLPILEQYTGIRAAIAMTAYQHQMSVLPVYYQYDPRFENRVMACRLSEPDITQYICDAIIG